MCLSCKYCPVNSITHCLQTSFIKQKHNFLETYLLFFLHSAVECICFCDTAAYTCRHLFLIRIYPRTNTPSSEGQLHLSCVFSCHNRKKLLMAMNKSIPSPLYHFSFQHCMDGQLSCMKAKLCSAL